jgi:hypothetical protein
VPLSFDSILPSISMSRAAAKPNTSSTGLNTSAPAYTYG